MAIMIRFTKAKKKPVKPKQPKTSTDVLAKLNDYLNQTEPETMRFLVGALEGMQNEVSYKELREAYLSGGLTFAQFTDWQHRYSKLVTDVLLKKWMEAAEQAAEAEKNKFPKFNYNPAQSSAMEWLKSHAAELVTNMARDQMDAINAMVRHFSGYTAITPDEAAIQIRACIGLTKPQALANVRYREAFAAAYMKQHPKTKMEVVERKARAAAAKYAGRQHRYRAMCIARTELAFGYNAGAYGATKDAQKQGYIGECKKKWLTAFDERVCPICFAMDGELADMDEKFTNGSLLPPGHPQCRCAVAYEEVPQTQPQPQPGPEPQPEPTPQPQPAAQPGPEASSPAAPAAQNAKPAAPVIPDKDPRIIELEGKIQEAEQLLQSKRQELAGVPAYNPENPMKAANLQRNINEIEKQIAEMRERAELIGRHPWKSDAFIDIIGQIEVNRIPAKEVNLLQKELTENEIIERLAGGDMTKGSCSSLAFSYIGNKNGLDVLDFRGGSSCDFFARDSNIRKFTKLDGVEGSVTMVTTEAKDTAKLLLQTLEKGKEYYLATGRHAAIVRKTDHGLEYLEMQARRESDNGWQPLGISDKVSDIESALIRRFACRKTADKQKIYGISVTFEKGVTLMDVDSFKGNDEFREILSYINTDPDKQKKGASGSVK